MQYVGLGVFLVLFLGIIVLLARSMTGNDRNDGSKHGGGPDDMTQGVDFASNGSPDDL